MHSETSKTKGHTINIRSIWNTATFSILEIPNSVPSLDSIEPVGRSEERSCWEIYDGISVEILLLKSMNMREIVIILRKNHKCARSLKARRNSAQTPILKLGSTFAIFFVGLLFTYTFQSNKNASEERKKNHIKSITRKRNPHKWNSKPSRELKNKRQINEIYDEKSIYLERSPHRLVSKKNFIGNDLILKDWSSFSGKVLTQQPLMPLLQMHAFCKWIVIKRKRPRAKREIKRK